MRGRARRAATAVAIAASTALTPAVVAAQATPSVVVDPADDLVDGQPIHVEGTGPAGDGAALVVCPTERVPGYEDCELPEIHLFEPPVFDTPVPRWMRTTTGLRDCAVVGCEVQVNVFRLEYLGPGVVQPVSLWTASAPVSFRPTRAVVAAPLSRVALGRSDVAASFLTAPPGSAAFAMRCAGVDRRIVCGEVGTVDTDFDGAFTGQVSSSRTWSAAGVHVDCAVHPCRIAVVVLGPGPTIVDLIGVDDPEW